ncbi:TetR family transcriptional regulator [Thalassospira profundimaris]|uniref:TetR family transcriptional regulator n=1 Tax=Thalassospira profundimaris TaxID=502049 RepID=A0A367WT69_9PROT|nr:TetR family transcriptional regulator [Thalassospira profundimaris]
MTDTFGGPKRKGERTRERILEIASQAVLEKGFGATSIEEIIAEAGLTKSGFFYHFSDKNELARALLQRYIEQDDEILDQVFDRARELVDDPLHQLLAALKMLAEVLEDLPNGHPGCIVAVYCYQERLFDKEVRDLNRHAVLAWRTRFRAILDDIADQYQTTEPVDLEQVADMISTVLEGGIVMSKALNEPRKLADQVMLLRSFLKLLFTQR